MRAVIVASLVLALAPRPSFAAPDPTIATVLSLASTLVPLLATTALWSTERGVDEGVRFDLGMVFLGVGAVAGPSIGQLYAGGGTNAVLSLILRAITGGVPTALLAVYDIYDASSTAMESRRKAATALVAPPPREVGPFTLCAAFAGGCSSF